MTPGVGEVQRLVRAYADKQAARYGITRAQWAVLAKVERAEGLKQTELAAAVKKRKDENPKVQATIAADQSTPHGAVIQLIDSVRKNGVSDFAINVDAAGN